MNYPLFLGLDEDSQWW